jgi:hypothetical protein
MIFMSSVRSNRTRKNIEILKKFGSIRFDSVRFGSIRFDSVRFDSVRFGSIRFGSVRFGSVRFGSIFQESSRVSLYYLALFTFFITSEINYKKKIQFHLSMSKIT